MQRRILIVICIIGIMSGFGLIFYPTISNLWNEYRNTKIAASYNKIVGENTKEELQRIRESADEYNKEHLKTGNYVKSVFNGSEEYLLNHPYESLLNPNGDGIMGYIEIPSIGVRIAIYHGVGTEALMNGCGHIEGTSLPVGGESTHAVLSAHRGLPSAELFTDLDQLKKGDVFYIHVLDQILAYEVTAIYDMVDPDDIGKLKIVNGNDLVTLLTCTPYSINTHRLLVTGSRISFVENEQETITTIDKISDLPMNFIVMLLGIAFSVVCIGTKIRREKMQA